MNVIDLIIISDKDDPDAAEIYVEAYIDSNLIRFILDTGSASTALQYNDITSALKSIGKKKSSGVFAYTSDDLIKLSQIRLGSISKEKFTVVRFPEGALGARNLIGMDLLKDHSYLFQFDEQKLIVDQPKPEILQNSIYHLFLDSKFHPYIDVHMGNQSLNAVWDTGAGIKYERLQKFRRSFHSFNN